MMTIREIEPRWLRRVVLVYGAIFFFGIAAPIFIIPFTLWDLIFHGWDEVKKGFKEFFGGLA